MILTKQGYLQERWKSKKSEWLIKYQNDPNRKKGIVRIGDVRFPEHLIGKKVRFKIELVDEK